MSTTPSEIVDQIKIISFGNSLHPITLILSSIFGLFFIPPIIDEFGIFFAGVTFILIFLCGYFIQQYLASQLKKILLDTIEVIDFYSQEIENKRLLLVGSIERDIAFDGVNIHDIDDIQNKFNSLLKSIYLFRKKLKAYFIIKLLCFSFEELDTSLNLKKIMNNMDIYLSLYFQRNLEIIKTSLNNWIVNHQIELFDVIDSVKKTSTSDLRGRGAFDLTIKSLESHISDFDRIRVHL